VSKSGGFIDEEDPSARMVHRRERFIVKEDSSTRKNH